MVSSKRHTRPNRHSVILFFVGVIFDVQGQIVDKLILSL